MDADMKPDFWRHLFGDGKEVIPKVNEGRPNCERPKCGRLMSSGA